MRPLEEIFTQRIELDRMGCRTVAGQPLTTAATLQALRMPAPALFVDGGQRLDPCIAAVFRPGALVLYTRDSDRHAPVVLPQERL